jgi:hypothetical protein
MRTINKPDICSRCIGFELPEHERFRNIVFDDTTCCGRPDKCLACVESLNELRVKLPRATEPLYPEITPWGDVF